MMEEKQPTIEEKLPAEVRANMLSSETSIYFNVALFEQVQRVATMFAKSTMVPDEFKGNVGNCMIALNYAYRLRADEFMVMQCLYNVHGKPGIEGKLVEAIINQSGKYSEPLEYEWLDPEDKITERQNVLKADVPSEYGCQAFTIDKKNGKRVTGPKITWQLVKGNGWYDNKGPDKTVESNKWRTMPEMMFYYRCASWFANKNCPELKLGMHTVEELQDIIEMQKMPDGSYKIQKSVTDKLKGKGAQSEGKDIDETKDVESQLKEKTEKKAKEKFVKEDSTINAIPAYKGLTKLKFSKWMKENMVSIPGMDQKHQDAIRQEHQKHFPGQSYPLDEQPEKTEELPEDKKEEANKSSELSEKEKKEAKILKYVEGSGLDDMGEVLVPCPNRENAMIQYKMCEPCMYQERGVCSTWENYDKAE